MLAIESRRDLVDADPDIEYADTDPVVDASDSLDARREREADMNISVSCSLTGEGPGTGGSGDAGGRDSGGLGSGLGKGLGSPAGGGGMNDGGAGKDDRRSGTESSRWWSGRCEVVGELAALIVRNRLKIVQR